MDKLFSSWYVSQLRWYAVVLFALAGFSVSVAQGTIRGNIFDENGEPLIGVFAYLKEDQGTGATTDLDGYYSLDVSAGEEHTLVVSYLSYETIELTFNVSDGEVLVKDFSMIPEAVALDVVTVVAKQERSSQYFMENIKKRSASTLDYISGDLMKKIGDNSVAAAISRVTGVSTTSSGFISVRGIGDRYVKTTVNGSVIPTLDPFTNNLRLDLFPSSFVDNIIITKTESPDLPGDWAAAYISVETKDIPGSLSISVTTRLGYNTQSTFKPFILSEPGPTDWLGLDNGFRDYDHETFVPVKPRQLSDYESMVGLGLEDFYSQMGVDASNFNQSDEFIRLGLVELGFLDKAFINDDAKFAEARSRLRSQEVSNEAFLGRNIEAEQSLSEFNNNWSSVERTTPIDWSQSVTIGNQTNLFGKPFSFLLGVRLGSSYLFDPNSRLLEASNTDSLTGNVPMFPDGSPQVESNVFFQSSRIVSGVNGIATASYKINSNNTVSVLFMPNLRGNNRARIGIDSSGSQSEPLIWTDEQLYEERAQFIYQAKSSHYFPGVAGRLNVNLSYTDGSSNIPQFKRVDAAGDDGTTWFLDATGFQPSSIFRELNEDVLDSRADMEMPLMPETEGISKLKFGLAFRNRTRDFTQYQYLLDVEGLREFDGTNFTEIFAPNFTFVEDGVGNVDIPLYYNRQDLPTIEGYQRVYAGFVMADHELTNRLRLSGGLRVEYGDLFTDVTLYKERGYEPGDPRRQTGPFLINPTENQEWSFLPSLNFIYRLRNDDLRPANLRLNYSRSIARPSIREFSEAIVIDYELRADVYGNPDLKNVAIDNVDLRYENYFLNRDYVSASLFYKNFKNHIEFTNAPGGFTWQNALKTYIYGIEIEGRKGIGEHFEARANVTLIQSFNRVEERALEIRDGQRIWRSIGIDERDIVGQAPYVINLIGSYNNNDWGLNASLSYNVQGTRLVIASGLGQVPDIVELPRNLLNFKVTKTLGTHWSVGITIKDILGSSIVWAYDYVDRLDFRRFKPGTLIQLEASYKL